MSTQPAPPKSGKNHNNKQKKNQSKADTHTFHEMHGRLGNSQWTAPEIARVCDEDARPSYQTCKAHEYVDKPDVLREKVALLASMLRRSKNCVLYTGAGISTAAGLNDYATKAENSLGKAQQQSSPLQACPTYAHHALVALHKQGMVHRWIQQNHDGLPQKAGFPQRDLNEIHGAWFDPSNPVVPMSGDLREDLLDDMVAWEDRADLCLAIGTSLCGMNADRVPKSVADRAIAKTAIGTVIISLQRTRLDEKCQLRIFGRIDTVLEALVSRLRLELPDPQRPFTTPYPHLTQVQRTTHKYENLPYDADGKLDRTQKTSLDLSVGARVRLVNQPQWDIDRLSNTATVTGITNDGHYKIQIEDRVRWLGLWWLNHAVAGEVDSIPLVNCSATTQ